MPPCELVRTLWNIRLAGWLDGLTGVLIGRSTGQDAKEPEHLSYIEALQSVLGDSAVPVIYDADIGHRPPQLNLINGSVAEVFFANGKGTIMQELK
jgi:muramoyltetrapeptide carboxypeptidase